MLHPPHLSHPPHPLPASRIRVRIHHHNGLVARGLAAALVQQADMELLGETAPAAAWAQVLVVDYPAGLALAGARALAGGPGGVPGRLLVVAQDNQAHAVRSALAAGVDGYLSLDCGVQDLLAGIRQLARGASYLGPAAARQVADSLQQSSLTERQHQVLRLVAQGQSNKRVAQALDITAGTVKSHMKEILGRLGARSRTHAMRIALERGLVEAGPSGA